MKMFYFLILSVCFSFSSSCSSKEKHLQPIPFNGYADGVLKIKAKDLITCHYYNGKFACDNGYRVNLVEGYSSYSLVLTRSIKKIKCINVLPYGSTVLTDLGYCVVTYEK